jgi:hypothetical protein
MFFLRSSGVLAFSWLPRISSHAISRACPTSCIIVNLVKFTVLVKPKDADTDLKCFIVAQIVIFRFEYKGHA